ncbi:hypothetical protein RvVAR031_pl00840 (plasmid) [Agrobacterium vitis]|nr:hypothetical protein RvVAR031_pl00840 [Agrobacterium vitis]
MPALGGAAAEPLRFMDFLLRDPVRTILLHGAGVSVVVPDPCRYAVHKLIVAGRRQNDAGGKAKKDKDLRQAGMLFEALQETGEGTSLAEALREAWDRGPSWRSSIMAGVDAVAKQYQPSVHQAFGILPTDEIEKAR